MSSLHDGCRRRRRRRTAGSRGKTEPEPSARVMARSESVDRINGINDQAEAGSTSEMLKSFRKALARMRVSALRSVKSLTRDRVPASHRKSMETRYANLLGRVALTTAAVEGVATAMVAGDVSSSLSCAAMSTTAGLLSDVYDLEEELINADEERDRLSSLGGETVSPCNSNSSSSSSSLQERLARWWFTTIANDR